MIPYYEDRLVTIYHGDCYDILPHLSMSDLLVTDPPQGITENSGRRLHAYRDPAKSKGRIGWSGFASVTDYGDTTWDFQPMGDDIWRLCKEKSKEQIVWGWNHLQGVLGKPPSILVWDKKCQNGWRDTFSDCEFAYCSKVMPDRMYRQLWMGALRQGRKVARQHPTQKPVELMAWCLSLFPDSQTCLDCYMGVGTTLVACREANRHCVGIEIKERYCEIAAKLCSQGIMDFTETKIPQIGSSVETVI